MDHESHESGQTSIAAHELNIDNVLKPLGSTPKGLVGGSTCCMAVVLLDDATAELAATLTCHWVHHVLRRPDLDSNALDIALYPAIAKWLWQSGRMWPGRDHRFLK